MLSPAEALALLSEEPHTPFEEQPLFKWPHTPFEERPLEVQLMLMGEWGCELDEISAETGLTEAQLRGEYAALILKGRTKGLRALREAQHNAAVTGGKPALLKHLGQHRLKQIDELLVTTASKGLDIISGANIKDVPKEVLIEMLKAKLAALESSDESKPTED